jgi:hypothetical protein
VKLAGTEQQRLSLRLRFFEAIDALSAGENLHPAGIRSENEMCFGRHLWRETRAHDDITPRLWSQREGHDARITMLRAGRGDENQPEGKWPHA